MGQGRRAAGRADKGFAEAEARSHAEIARRDRMLFQAERLKTLRAMSVAVIHEISQPLAGIMANASTGLRMLSAEPADLNQAREALEDIIKDGRRVVLSPFVRDEPIVASKVGGPNARASLSTVIQPGMRAVTVPVDDVRGVAGFIFPGDFVDIALTRTGGGKQSPAA